MALELLCCCTYIVVEKAKIYILFILFFLHCVMYSAGGAEGAEFVGAGFFFLLLLFRFFPSIDWIDGSD